MECLNGVPSKRTGLEKAIYQIEEAIKKSKTDRNDPSQDGAVNELQRLVDDARAALPESSLHSSPLRDDLSLNNDGIGQQSDDQLALDDAENPLQLLARASDLRLSTPQSSSGFSPGGSTASPSDKHVRHDSTKLSEVQYFFQPMKATLDLGPKFQLDTDPIVLGLVTESEAEMLVGHFFKKLAHTRWGLDPHVHTIPFMRSRSPFLFTTVLASAALFIPTAESLYKRLSVHKKALVERLMTRRLRSVEIVLGFMINIPWMHPGKCAADDDTGLYISMALSVALDLSLNKITVPTNGLDPDHMKRIPKADCITAKRALAMDGFDDVDPASEWGRRLLRRRERAWIALFVLERGVCLARGRSHTVPVTPLVELCDDWHTVEPINADDGAMVSMTVLRRDLDHLFRTVRSRCDSYRVIDVGSKVAKEIEASIENFFSQWLAKWTAAIGEGEQMLLPPYVEILVAHTRLSTYSGVINHPTAPLEVKHFFRAAALSSALNVMRAAIQGEHRLNSMPNNTAIMISFAACVALNLSTPTAGGHVLAPSIRNLIEETADVLERLGSIPAHRNGASVLYGKYLREIIRQAPQLMGLDVQAMPVPSETQPRATNYASNQVFDRPQSQAPHYQEPSAPTDSFQFSAMSDNEIVETVLRAGSGLDATLADIPMEDLNGLMWSDLTMNAPEFGF